MKECGQAYPLWDRSCFSINMHMSAIPLPQQTGQGLQLGKMGGTTLLYWGGGKKGWLWEKHFVYLGNGVLGWCLNQSC